MQVQEIGRRGGCSMSVMKGELLLMGGASREKEFKDIHLVRLEGAGSSRKVSIFRQPTSQEVISERHAMATASLSPEKTLLFGGQSFVQQTHYDQMLEVSLDNEKVQVKVLPGLHGPSARNSAALCLDSQGKKAFLYGGADNEGVKHDLFSYCLQSGEYRQLEVAEWHKEQGREMHALFYYKGHLGGIKHAHSAQDQAKVIDINIMNESAQENAQQVQGLSKVDIQFNEEAQQEGEVFPEEEEEQEVQQPAQPQPKEDFSQEEHLIIIGGRSLSSISASVLIVSLSTMTYSSCALPHPLCAMSTCQVGGMVYLYGGTDGASFLSSLYRLDLSTMALSRLSETPLPGRIAASMAYLPQHNELAIFGGSLVEQEDNQFFFIQLNQAVFTPVSQL